MTDSLWLKKIKRTTIISKRKEKNIFSPQRGGKDKRFNKTGVSKRSVGLIAGKTAVDCQSYEVDTPCKTEAYPSCHETALHTHGIRNTLIPPHTKVLIQIHH